MPRVPFRLILSLLYLGAVLFVTGAIIYRLRAFEGVLVVEQDRAERWVVRPSETGSLFSLVQRGMPAELISFDNPRAALRILDEQELYDAVMLPFRLQVKGAEILEQLPDKDVLEVVHSGERTLVDAEAGVEISIPEGRITVQGVQPWQGLIHNAMGKPMAMVTIRQNDDDWPPPLFLSADEGLRIPQAGLLLLQVFPDESAARAASLDAAVESHSARWGVRDEGRINWFHSLIPGTGATTSGGVEYTLMDVRKSSAGDMTHIRVQIEDTTGVTVRQVGANQVSEDDPLLFEFHRNELVVWLRAWRDGAVLVSVFLRNEPLGEEFLEEGGSLTAALPGGASLQLRLEQYLMNALAVYGDSDAVNALALDTPDGVLRIREGMSTQIRETRLRYRRMPSSPRVRYQVRAVFGREKPALELTLDPGDNCRVEDWRFYHDQENIGAASVAVLRAKRSPGTGTQYLGAFLFVVCAVGLTVVRFNGRKREIQAHQDREEEPHWIAVTEEDTPAGNTDTPEPE